VPQLKGFPDELAPELDMIARSLVHDPRLEKMGLLGVEWKIPPPDDAFTMRYGKGEEEGDPTVYVTIDRIAHAVIAIRETR
jgi:hypothetical protein